MKKSSNTIEIFLPDGEKKWGGGTDEPMCVVETIGVGWHHQRSELIDLFIKQSKIGFFNIRPWTPRDDEIEKHLKNHFPNFHSVKSNIFGYFEMNERNMNILIETWYNAGLMDSGECQIGGCQKEFNESVFDDLDDGLMYFLREISLVDCVISLKEMQQATLIFRPFEGMENFLKTIEECSTTY